MYYPTKQKRPLSWPYLRSSWLCFWREPDKLGRRSASNKAGLISSLQMTDMLSFEERILESSSPICVTSPREMGPSNLTVIPTRHPRSPSQQSNAHHGNHFHNAPEAHFRYHTCVSCLVPFSPRCWKWGGTAMCHKWILATNSTLTEKRAWYSNSSSSLSSPHNAPNKQFLPDCYVDGLNQYLLGQYVSISHASEDEIPSPLPSLQYNPPPAMLLWGKWGVYFLTFTIQYCRSQQSLEQVEFTSLSNLAHSGYITAS